MQTLYRAVGSSECAQIPFDGPIRNCRWRSSLRARPRLYVVSELTQGLQFQALHPLSFFFICTLYWCKLCTVLEIGTNVRKFHLTALFVIADDGVVCGPVLIGMLFVLTHGLHFQSLQPNSFLFICTLHWCKHCTVL